MDESILYRAEKIILILIFGLSIYIPFIGGVIQEDKISSTFEKRNLTKLPSIPKSIKEFKQFPEIFTLYYSDHFGLRETFTKAYFRLLNKLSDKSSVDDVTVGQDGWLFLGSIKPGYTKFNDPMGDAVNANLFPEKELVTFARSLMSVKNWLHNRGIEYVYIIAPNKHTIYSDKLPTYISKQNKESATDQLVSYLQEHTDIAVVDLRQVLKEEKKRHQAYFKTDTHWNHYGANAAQFSIMNKIKTLFPEKISPFLLNDSQFKILIKGGGDLAKFAKIENIKRECPQPVFENECIPVLEIIQTNDKKRQPYTMVCEAKELTAVIFRDSFFSALDPYISRYFHRSTYIWEKINYNSLMKYVEQEKPDIIIEEVIERSLPYIPSASILEFTAKNE